MGTVRPHNTIANVAVVEGLLNQLKRVVANLWLGGMESEAPPGYHCE